MHRGSYGPPASDRTLGIDMLGFNPYAMLADLRAVCLLGMGRTAEGVQWFQNAIQRAREDHDLFMLGSACADYGGMCSEVGDPQVTLAHARQGVELGEKAGGPETRAFAYTQLGRAYIRVGTYVEAVTSLERSRAIARESHMGFEIEPFATAYLAEAYAYSGDADRALRTAEEAVAGARQRTFGMLPFVQLALARVLLRTKGLAARGAIEAALGELSRLARRMELKMLEPFIYVERAELARLSGDETTRQRELREAHHLFLEIGAPIRAAELAKELTKELTG
jgi:tetratricopeptide (TPR) repeat protein